VFVADVLCLGEILVDWVSTKPGLELSQSAEFCKSAGGAPANVAVGLVRQGMSAAFLGRVSTDQFGKWLKSVLSDEGVDTTGTIDDAEAQTRMAYVVTTPNGDRKLAEFSRIAVADSRLAPSDLKESQFAGARALHFGSISLISSPSAEATFTAIDLARTHNLLISYDPNIRLGLWASPEICRRTILSTLKLAHLVKINLAELEFLTGSAELSSAESLALEHDLPLLVITLDWQGACFVRKAGRKTIPGFKVPFVEATGAGDAFVAGILLGLINEIGPATDKRRAISHLPSEILSAIVRRANAVGALACTRCGAIPALPKREEVKLFLSRCRDATSPQALNDCW
jgi:fructokinase